MYILSQRCRTPASCWDRQWLPNSLIKLIGMFAGQMRTDGPLASEKTKTDMCFVSLELQWIRRERDGCTKKAGRGWELRTDETETSLRCFPCLVGVRCFAVFHLEKQDSLFSTQNLSFVHLWTDEETALPENRNRRSEGSRKGRVVVAPWHVLRTAQVIKCLIWTLDYFNEGRSWEIVELTITRETVLPVKLKSECLLKKNLLKSSWNGRKSLS